MVPTVPDPFQLFPTRSNYSSLAASSHGNACSQRCAQCAARMLAQSEGATGGRLTTARWLRAAASSQRGRRHWSDSRPGRASWWRRARNCVELRTGCCGCDHRACNDHALRPPAWDGDNNLILSIALTGQRVQLLARFAQEPRHGMRRSSTSRRASHAHFALCGSCFTASTFARLPELPALDGPCWAALGNQHSSPALAQQQPSLCSAALAAPELRGRTGSRTWARVINARARQIARTVRTWNHSSCPQSATMTSLICNKRTSHLSLSPPLLCHELPGNRATHFKSSELRGHCEHA